MVTRTQTQVQRMGGVCFYVTIINVDANVKCEQALNIYVNVIAGGH